MNEEDIAEIVDRHKAGYWIEEKHRETIEDGADTEQCENCGGGLDDDGLCPHCFDYDDY